HLRAPGPLSTAAGRLTSCSRKRSIILEETASRDVGAISVLLALRHPGPQRPRAYPFGLRGTGMTEQQWRQCADPDAMRRFLEGRASDRHLRLFACACCRRVWHLLQDESSREAVRIAEAFADGNAAEADLRVAFNAVFDFVAGASGCFADDA